MQSLISQITNIFATQSVNSIENNGLGLSLSGDQQFSGIFESLADTNKPANFAMFNGQGLPPSYTPISFHVSQLSLTARPLTANGDFEIQGELLQADITPNTTHNFTSTATASISVNGEYAEPIVNPNAVPMVPIALPEAGKPVRETAETNLNSVKQATVDPLSINHKDKQPAYTQNSPIMNSEPDKNSSLSAPVINSGADKSLSLSNENSDRQSVAKQLTSGIDKELIQPANTAVRDNRPVQNSRSSSVVNNYNIDIEKTTFTANYTNQVTNHETAQKISTASIDNRNLVQANIQTTNAPQPSENLSAGKLSEELTPVNNNSLNSNVISEDEVLSVKSDISAKSNINESNVEYDKSKQQDFRNQVVNQLNAQQLNNTKDVTQPISTDIIEESVSNKPIYNVNQFDETKRNESSYRNDRSPISLQSYENISSGEKSGFANQTNQNNGSQLDLMSSFNKTQDFSAEIKTLTANNAVDNKLHANPLLSDPLAASDKSLSLDKSALQLTSSSEVKNGDELAKQITWAKNNNANHVRIALSPEHLGALEISIDQDRDGLNIQFTTQNALAKDAIETFMPRLKDMLEQQGLNLQNANVSQQSSGGHADGYDQATEQYSVENDQQNSQTDMQTVADSNHHSTNNYLLEAFA